MHNNRKAILPALAAALLLGACTDPVAPAVSTVRGHDRPAYGATGDEKDTGNVGSACGVGSADTSGGAGSSGSNGGQKDKSCLAPGMDPVSVQF